MFKSVFAKYITTFTALLLASFLLLLLIVSSIFNNYSKEAEQRNMQGVAVAVSGHLSELYATGHQESFSDFLKDGADTATDGEQGYLSRLLRAVMTNHEDMTVYVTDASGGFIFSTGKSAETSPAPGTVILSEKDLTALRDSFATEGSTAPSPAAAFSSLDDDGIGAVENGGVFLSLAALATEDGTPAFLFPVLAGNQAWIGYVIVTSTADAWNNMMSTTLRSIAVAGLWIMLAALIAIYFTTEKIISPLREISRASKKLMVGQFDVRVPVRGRDEVAELAMAFNQMAQALQNLDSMRNSFVANVSHDLRTPMTTISGFIDGILDGIIPPEQHAQYLQVVSDEVRRLSRLVTALLDVSRLQAGDRKFDMKPFDVCEMGRQILISFEQKIGDKGLDVEFDCDDERMFVVADRDAIHQILYNICDNAVKFSTPGGKLRMSFAWSPVEHGRRRKATVTVYNEGQGIPAEDIPFVFERFYKSDKSRSLDKSGVGLGMFISKTIIEAHGETISVASDYGKNCSFTFTLTKADQPITKGRVGHGQGGNP